MVYSITILLFLLVGSYMIGLYKSLYIEFILELNTFTTNYYQIGIFFYSEDNNNGELIEKVSIGFFFFNIVIAFHKDNI